MQGDTHFYDGKLGETRQLLLSDLLRIAEIRSKEKLNLFARFAALLASQPSSTLKSRENFAWIVRDYQDHGSQKGPNYDPTNQFAAEDLLYLTGELIMKLPEENKKDFLDLTNEQLIEMSSGMCAQGRVYRLLYVILSCREIGENR